MMKFEHITTDAAVETYKSARGVFDALLHEVRELSKKKPDATLNRNKVKLINSVLSDLMSILGTEPEGKYLHILEDEELPQVSDALMMMVQFHAVLATFRNNYLQSIELSYANWEDYWITEEQIDQWSNDQAKIIDKRIKSTN